MIVFKKGSYNSEQLRELYDVIYSANYFFKVDNHCINANVEPLCEFCKSRTVCNDLQNLLDYLEKLIDRKS